MVDLAADVRDLDDDADGHASRPDLSHWFGYELSMFLGGSDDALQLIADSPEELVDLLGVELRPRPNRSLTSRAADPSASSARH